MVFSIDSNADHVEKFFSGVEYLRQEQGVITLDYAPALWQNGHFHFELEGIVYQLVFNDLLGLELRVDGLLRTSQWKKVHRLVAKLKQFVNH